VIVRSGVLMAAAPLLGCGHGCRPGPTTAPPEPSADLVCDRDYLGTLEAMVEGAEDRVDGTQWELFPGESTARVEALLGAAAARGVRVRFVLDDTIEDNAAAVERLGARGVEARLDGVASVDLHAKTWLIDGRDALVGSTNLSDSSIERNHECNLRLREGAGPANLAAWFDAVWGDPATRPVGAVAPHDPHVRALTEDALLDSLLAGLGGASSRIDFTLYATFLQPGSPKAPAMQVFQALADAAARGVAVRGIAEQSDFAPDNNARNAEAVAWLSERGVDMRWDPIDTITHAKSFRFDGALQIQTANVSTSGLERNHEAGAWTDDPDVVAASAAWFEAIWAESAR
jgi:phosphatidylserine/phosphatidylglycerophosphate/cardiolipin synthase-like enzyme